MLGISVWTVRKQISRIKKGGDLVVQQGRPRKVALSTYPKKLRDLIFALRASNEGWGSISILVELAE